MKITKKTLHHFHGKQVLISGGSGGLGLALAEKLREVCKHVFLLDINEPEHPLSENVSFIKCDITDSHEVQEICSSLPKLDVLINNAGVTHMSLAVDCDIETIERTLNINLLGAMYLTRAALPGLIANKGQIIAISSVAGYTPLYGRSVYSASKHGLEGYCLSIASEYEDAGLTVSVVRPAYIKTQPNKVARTNSGTLSPGAMKKQSQGNELSPEQAAIEILNRVAKQQLFVYIGGISKIAKILFSVTPRLYMKLMRHRSQAEFK